MNPIIKFTTLFGLLALELALELQEGSSLSYILTAVFFAVALVYVVKSFTDLRNK
jgi:K(+)-stimulated pyrophosphate-energized sodium pump